MAEILNPYQQQQQAAFDFWAPVYVDNKGKLYSPGFTDDRGDKLNPWDYVVINGVPTPGLVEVVVRRNRDVDRKKAAGQDGATTTLHGNNPAEIEIRLTIWTPEHLKALNTLWPTLMTPAYKTTTKTVTSTQYATGIGAGDQRDNTTTATTSGGTASTTTIPVANTIKTSSKVQVTTPVTFDVSHPALKLHGIRSIQIVGGQGPDAGPVARSRVFTIHAVEFLPPKKGKNVTNTPTASVGSTRDPQPSAQPGTDPKHTGP